MNIEEILAEVQPEGSPVELEGQNEDEGGKETPSESPAEDKPADEAPSQEGAKAKEDATQADNKASIPDETNNLPFNKHPRWQEKLDEISNLKSERDIFLSKIDDLEKRFNELATQKPQASQESIPAWFSTVWGDDQKAWEEAKQSMSSGIVSSDLISKLVNDAIVRRDIEQQQNREKENTWVKESFKKIEDTFGVSLPEGSDERNEFVNWVLKVRPTTDDGVSFDLIRGYEAWQEIQGYKKASASGAIQAKKQVAALTTSDRAASPALKQSSDPNKIREMSFRELALQAAIDEGIIQ